MRIGLDFDGIFSDCGQLKADWAKTLYGVGIPPESFKKEIVVGGGLLSAQQYHDLQERIYGEREIGLQMKPVDGVLEYYPRLIANGYDIDIITLRGEVESEIAREWSADLGLDLKIISVDWRGTKAEAARGCQAFADDDFDKLEPLVGVVPNLYLFSWGYNSDVDTRSVAERVFSWEHLYNQLSGLAK